MLTAVEVAWTTLIMLTLTELSKPNLLGDAGDFPSRQHDAQAQQQVVLEREQAQKQQGRLEESGQA